MQTAPANGKDVRMKESYGEGLQANRLRVCGMAARPDTKRKQEELGPGIEREIPNSGATP